METLDVAVLGAGISGLAAARALRRLGREVVVLEAEATPGGCLRSRRQAGFIVELGPNTVQESPELLALCADAGCGDQLVPALPEAKKRYVVFDGRLVALPGSPPALLGSPLLSWGAKLRLATEPFRRRGPGPREPVAEFFRRRLGSQAAERLGDAMVLGIYAGDPAELAVGYAFRRVHALEQEHGSLIRGMLRRRRQGAATVRQLVSFRDGLGTLAERLAADLDLRCDCRATSLAPGREGFRLTVRDSHGEERLEARQLVVALPQDAAWELLAPLVAGPVPELLPASPVAVVALGFRRADVGHPLDGFGFLAPHREGRRVLGCLFTSSLFAGRAPDGHVLLTAMVGGRRRPELVALDDDALRELVLAELRDLLDVRGEPVLAVVERWRPGIPQPTAAWAALDAAAAGLEERFPGLTVLGNWRHGVGIPDCVAAGWSLGGRITGS